MRLKALSITILLGVSCAFGQESQLKKITVVEGNQTMILISYTEKEIERARKEYDLLKIKSVEAFNKNMPKFAARPEFILSLDNNMPGFKNYLVELNGIPVKAEYGHFFINLINGINTIEAVAENQNDVEGVPTSIKNKYE